MCEILNDYDNICIERFFTIDSHASIRGHSYKEKTFIGDTVRPMSAPIALYVAGRSS